MSEFRSRPEEGFNNEFVPDFEGMDFGAILNGQEYDGGTQYELEEFPEDDMPKNVLSVEELREDPYRRFERMCREQGVTIDKELASGPDYSFRIRNAMSDDLKIARSIAVAGQILRKDPERKLADQPIDLPTEHEIPRCETQLKTLGNIINSSIERPPIEELPEHQYQSQGIGGMDMCQKAEPLFDKSIPKFMRFSNKVSYQAIVDGYSDEGWDVVAVRKREGLPSVLTFEEIAIDGIVYPPGSIMRFHLRSDGVEPESGLFENNNSKPSRIVESDEVIRAGFLRLANGYAESPEYLNSYRERLKKDLERYGELI